MLRKALAINMYTFKKEERLCSKRLLEKLFHNGSSFLLYPYRIVWLAEKLPAEVPVQVVINVPKRRFKKAVDRNLIKRRIREIYRLNKSEQLYSYFSGSEIQLLVGIHYVGKDIPDYGFMDKKLKLAFEQLKNLSLKRNEE